MKKTKLLGLTTLLLSLGLAGCFGGGDTDSDPNKTEYVTDKDTHTLVDGKGNTIEGPTAHDWVEDTGRKSVDPTCTLPGKKYLKCSVCKRKGDEDIPALGHNMVDNPAYTEDAPTCTTGGSIHQKCSRPGCTYEVNEDKGALGHDMQDVPTNKDGVTKGACSRGDVVEYVLDISKTDSGWKDAASKWNVKSGDTAKATWNVQGIIDDGDYSIALECKMTSSGHTSRYWFNHAKFGKDDDGNPADSSSESDYRYWFQVNSGANINTDNDKTWGDNNMSDTDFTWVTVVSRATLAGVNSFSAYHGNIGYSLIISKIKLVKLA